MKKWSNRVRNCQITMACVTKICIASLKVTTVSLESESITFNDGYDWDVWDLQKNSEKVGATFINEQTYFEFHDKIW